MFMGFYVDNKLHAKDPKVMFFFAKTCTALKIHHTPERASLFHFHRCVALGQTIDFKSNEKLRST